MARQNQRWMTFLVAITSALAGVVTARCERPPVMSVLPPFDQCCACLATRSTPRGARCSRGTIPDCISDFERLDILGSETNIRCIRDVCGNECSVLASQLPSGEVVNACCQCLADGSEEGTDCYSGTAEQCATEIEEGEINRLLQGSGLCLQGSCAEPCAPLFGAVDPAVDAGAFLPDASVPQGDGGGAPDAAGSSSSRMQQPRPDGGATHPWDGGCPLPPPFTCD